MDTLADPGSEVKQSLAVEVLRRFGEARLRVTGSSMLCAMWPGDLVAVRRQSMAEIRQGHVVLFVRDGRFFAHRVVGKIRRQDRTLLVTRGDRLKKNDPPVSPAELLGRVTGVIRGRRCLVPSFTFWRQAGSWALRRSELGTRMALRLGSREQFTWEDLYAACTGVSMRRARAGLLPAISGPCEDSSRTVERPVAALKLESKLIFSLLSESEILAKKRLSWL